MAMSCRSTRQPRGPWKSCSKPCFAASVVAMASSARLADSCTVRSSPSCICSGAACNCTPPQAANPAARRIVSYSACSRSVSRRPRARPRARRRGPVASGFQLADGETRRYRPPIRSCRDATGIPGRREPSRSTTTPAHLVTRGWSPEKRRRGATRSNGMSVSVRIRWASGRRMLSSPLEHEAAGVPSNRNSPCSTWSGPMISSSQRSATGGRAGPGLTARRRATTARGGSWFVYPSAGG